MNFGNGLTRNLHDLLSHRVKSFPQFSSPHVPGVPLASHAGVGGALGQARPGRSRRREQLPGQVGSPRGGQAPVLRTQSRGRARRPQPGPPRRGGQPGAAAPRFTAAENLPRRAQGSRTAAGQPGRAGNGAAAARGGSGRAPLRGRRVPGTGILSPGGRPVCGLLRSPAVSSPSRQHRRQRGKKKLCGSRGSFVGVFFFKFYYFFFSKSDSELVAKSSREPPRAASPPCALSDRGPASRHARALIAPAPQLLMRVIGSARARRAAQAAAGGAGWRTLQLAM